MILLLALFIGIIAGLRAFTAPAAIAFAAASGFLHLDGSWLAFLGYRFTPWIFGALALFELVGDQLPSTPSRKVPMQFGTRLVMGGLSGAAIGIAGGALIAGLAAGLAGAVIGTLGGAAARAKLAGLLGKDLPAALIEDAVAVGGALLVVAAIS